MSGTIDHEVSRLYGPLLYHIPESMVKEAKPRGRRGHVDHDKKRKNASVRARVRL